MTKCVLTDESYIQVYLQHAKKISVTEEFNAVICVRLSRDISCSILGVSLLCHCATLTIRVHLEIALR